MTSATTDQPATAKTTRVCPYCRERPAIRAGNCAECQSTYLSGKPLVTFDGKTFVHGAGPSIAEWLERTYGPGDGFKSATLLTDEERAALKAPTRKTAKSTTKGATMPKTAATAKSAAANAPTAKRGRKDAAVVAAPVEVQPAPVTGKRKPSAKPAPATAPAQTVTAKARASRTKTAEKAALAVAPAPTAPPAASDGARATNGHNAPKGKQAARKPLTFKDGQAGTSRDAEVQTESFAEGMTSQKRSRRVFAGAFDADAVKRGIAAVRRDLDKLEAMLSLAAVQPDGEYADIMRANGVAHVAPAPAPAASKSTTAKSAVVAPAKQRTTKAPTARKPASAAGTGRDVQATLDDVYEFTGIRLPAGRSTRYWLEHWRELKPLVTGSDPAGRNPTRGILPGQDDRLPRTVIADKASGGMTLPALARITGYKNGRALADDIADTFTYITAVRKYWMRGKG